MIPLRADWIAGALIAGAVVVAATTAWVWRYQQGKNAGKEEVQALWDKDKLLRSEANFKAIKELVAERNQQQQRADHAEQQLIVEQERSARTVAELRAYADSLRNEIGSFATGGRDASSDNLEACRARALTLGRLLDSTLRDATACAERGERDASIARTLHNAWPVSKSAH